MKICLLRRPSPTLLGELMPFYAISVKSLEPEVKPKPSEWMVAWRCISISLMEYRRGKFREAADWAAADRGRRLDHVWVSKPMVKKLQGAKVFQEARGWTQPSDHVPVLVEIDA